MSRGPASARKADRPPTPAERAAADKAEAAIAAGDWPAAIAALRRLVKRPKPPASALYNLAKALIEAGEPGQARHWLERAVIANPAYAAAWFELGRFRLSEDGPTADALHAFARAAALDPTDVDAVRNAARIAERRAAFERALALWTQLLAEAAFDADAAAEAALGRVRALYETGALDDAEAEARALSETAPSLRAKLFVLQTRVAKGRIRL